MWKNRRQRERAISVVTPSPSMANSVTPTRFRWQKKRYSLRSRQFDIITTALGMGTTLGWDVLLSTSPKQQRRRARQLVNTLISLGPTFIKIGQSLSTRIDLLPPIYIEAFGELQDRVPAFPVAEAIAIIETELCAPINTLFAIFDPIPLAAASLGQVHRARLHTGEEVVVKVQRPGLQQLFDLDFRVIYQLLRWCDRLFPWMREYDLMAIYQEFFILLYQEIDYTKEGQNADRFRANFKDNKLVIAPQIYWQYTTSKVLTMSYLPGIKVNDRATLEACGFNPKQINQIGICCYLKQLLLDGFFQADPHPGNMAVTADGKLVIYDFGMMAELKSLSKGHMVDTFWAVLKKDSDTITDRLVDMGLVVPVADLQPVKKVVEFLLERFTERPVDIKEFNQIKSELATLFVEQPFRLPPEMTFILKSLATLDGIARSLDPEYNLILAAQPFIKSIAITEKGSFVSKFGKQAVSYLNYKIHQPSKTEVLIHRLERRLERGELEISVRSVATEKQIQRLYLAIKNLICLCFTGFTGIGGIVLLSSYPIGSLTLFGLASVGAILWLRSLLNLAIQDKIDRFIRK
jgi:predicted unusual protein kinase regulating ubiquinone biosynthesis (AarF/ABC1/UbiB family)